MERYKPMFEKFSLILAIDGRKVYDTNHSVDRFKERFPDLSIDKWYKGSLVRGIKKILKKYKDEPGYYLIESRRWGFGIQLEWRPDRYDNSINQGFTATTLDRNEMKTLKNNEKIIVVESKKLDDIGYYRVQPLKELNLSGYMQYIQEGKVNVNYTRVGID